MYSSFCQPLSLSLSGVMWHLVPLAWKKLHFWLGQCKFFTISVTVLPKHSAIWTSKSIPNYSKLTEQGLYSENNHTNKVFMRLKRLKCLFNIFSVELRELEAKLKAGFMNRERAAQLAEKRAMALDSKVRCNANIFSKLYVLLVLIL